MALTLKQRAVTMKRQGFDDGVVGAVLGLEAAAVQSLLYDATPDVAVPAQLIISDTAGIVIPAGTVETVIDSVTLPEGAVAVASSAYLEVEAVEPGDQVSLYWSRADLDGVETGTVTVIPEQLISWSSLFDELAGFDETPFALPVALEIRIGGGGVPLQADTTIVRARIALLGL